jgi:Cof subfamily protein (haloacid dehalogenase superfamily)
MSKIVFFDIDGTLLDHDKKLPDKTKQAIKELKKNGTFVAIATGRAPFMFEGLRKELEIDSFVSFNGSYVMFENEMIYKQPLHSGELEQLHMSAQLHGHPMLFMDEKTMKSSVSHHQYIEECMGSLKFPHPELDPSFYQNREIFQSLLFIEEKNESLYYGQSSQFEFIRWHRYSVDILPKGGSKAEGIKKMVDRLGFNLKDVFAFGDGLNDMQMIQAVGNGIAMGNALDELKAHAQFVTKDVDEDGIWYGLKELNLI